MKMRITIDVERVGMPLRETDLREAAINAACLVELEDAGTGPFDKPVDISRGGHGLLFSYTVEEMP